MGFKETMRKIQGLWYYVSIIFPILGVVLFMEALKTRSKIIELGYEVRPTSDIAYMAIASVVVYIMRTGIYRLVKSFSERRVELLYEKELWVEKKRKITHYCSGTVWYSIATGLGVYVLWGAETVPKMFLGSCDNMTCTMAQYPQIVPIRLSFLFAMMQIGSRIFSLVDHIERMRGADDFYELLLHHFLTIFGTLHSYYTNCENLAMIVLAIHDVGDWVYKASHLWRDMFPNHYPALSVPPGIFFFFVVRVIMQPIWFLDLAAAWLREDPIIHKNHSDFVQVWEASKAGIWFQAIMVGALYLLNCYWSLLIFRIIWNKAVKGVWANELHGDSVHVNKKNADNKEKIKNQ